MNSFLCYDTTHFKWIYAANNLKRVKQEITQNSLTLLWLAGVKLRIIIYQGQHKQLNRAYFILNGSFYSHENYYAGVK